MSSVICQNFVQNAWKKELCSNCFKSKNEHQERNILRPLPIISKKIEGIIKNGKKSKFKKRSVKFPSQLSEVIGYGGEDWSSDTEEEYGDDYDGYDDIEESNSDTNEIDNELIKITKSNTDYNGSSLHYDFENKKTYTSLMLGKPIIDSEGNKKTLLVTVKPFGEDVQQLPKKIKKNFKQNNVQINKNNKECLTDGNKKVILKSYTKNEELMEEKTLLDEINETLENTKKDTLKIISKETLINSNKENIDNDNVVHKSEKKITLTRTPALKRESTPKIEFVNSKNKLNEDIKKTEDNFEKEQNIDEDLIKNDTLIKNTKWEVDEKNNEEQGSSESINSSNDMENVTFQQSREQAGEPDGRADPDNLEPPALPLTPPPLLDSNQTSFLHSTISSTTKPKIPTKPSNTFLIRKPVIHHHVDNKNQILSTFTNDSDSKELVKQNLTDTDIGGVINKRRAPKTPEEDGLFVRKPLNSINSISPPVVREKEKRERASSCTKTNFKIENEIPEPAPRKLLSTSSDNLTIVEDYKKKDKRGKFSLKKFLRMGSNKDLSKLPLENCKFDEFDSSPPMPKPRLVIVHPSELNGDKVEVVTKQLPFLQEEDKQTNDYMNINVCTKNTKPQPPPRNEDSQKPPISPPPKSLDVLNIQKQVSRNNSFIKKGETVYANIGEVRSSIVPNKPVRTASMREREALQQKQQLKEEGNYSSTLPSLKRNEENLYEYINSGRSSSPDSDSSREKEKSISKTNQFSKLNKRSESNIDVSGDYFKYNNIPRSLSLTYCGSETESEIYSNYNFYGSESEVAEDDHEWMQNSRTYKLRSKKGRSIVHKNLEDNYGAVIVANHEALAQVLENIQQTVHISPVLRGLKILSNLRWNDFSIKTTVNPLILGKNIFYQALWGTHHVTLFINQGFTPSCTLSLGTFNLHPITEFSDLIPINYLGEYDENKQIQATITVLPWMQVNTIQSFSNSFKKSSLDDEYKDSLFILLQLVNALKVLQAQGIEELPISLNSFILCKDMEREVHHKLYVLQGLSEELSIKNEKFGTLCNCATKALQLLQPTSKITSLLQSLLNNERATSLTQVKSVLEFSLWGPSDVILGNTIKERELALQRWLDLQRATVLHGLVCTRVQLTTYEEYHLLFLVRSNARMMCDASLLLESNLKKK